MSTSRVDDDTSAHAGRDAYLLCWLALIALTGLTFGLSHLELGLWSLPVALLIAVTKASIVALFFMHLANQRGLSRMVLVTSAVFVVLLASLVVADVLTRFPLALPPR